MLTYNNGRVLIHRKTKENSMKKINKTKIALCDIHNAKLISLPQNDSGNVERFLLYCKEFVKYNQTTQSWFYWNGKYWQEDAEAGKISSPVLNGKRHEESKGQVKNNFLKEGRKIKF